MVIDNRLTNLAVNFYQINFKISMELILGTMHRNDFVAKPILCNASYHND